MPCEDSDQTALMHRVFCVFAGRTCILVENAVPKLVYNNQATANYFLDEIYQGMKVTSGLENKYDCYPAYLGEQYWLLSNSFYVTFIYTTSSHISLFFLSFVIIELIPGFFGNKYQGQ